MLTSDAEDHLANLDHCGTRSLRQAYLAVMLAAERAGYRTEARAKGGLRELQIRDRARSQPFAMVVAQGGLSFHLRRPALDAQPGLAGQAQARFAERMLSDANSLSEVRIRISDERDADDLAAWLFESQTVSPGYEARRSA